MILSTAGPDGIDASPRGDNDEAVRIVDARTLSLSDWRGNNRFDPPKYRPRRTPQPDVYGDRR